MKLTKEQKSELYNSYKSKKIFDKGQLREIRSGINRNVDISIYADVKYRDDQMEEIKFAIEQELEYKWLLNVKYSSLLMNWIRAIIYNDKHDGVIRTKENLKKELLDHAKWFIENQGWTEERCNETLKEFED